MDRRPVWFMRQAGRYLPEYQGLKGDRAFLDLVQDPAAATEITCQPIARFDLDAAIVFSDILVPFLGMGLDVTFGAEGPRVGPPVRDRASVERLEAFDPDARTGFLGETIRLVRRRLGPDRAIIGFCGGPLTMAAYAIEGGPPGDFARTRALLRDDRATFEELMARIVDATIPYLGMQAFAGADALQIFESWGAALDVATFASVVQPHVERLVACAKSLDVPVILYARDGAPLLEALAQTAPDVLGVSEDADGAAASARFGADFALQGNLDPRVLAGDPAAAARAARLVLDAFATAPGHVFNVGGGITPDARVDCVAAVVDAVRAWTPPR